MYQKLERTVKIVSSVEILYAGEGIDECQTITNEYSDQIFDKVGFRLYVDSKYLLTYLSTKSNSIDR